MLYLNYMYCNQAPPISCEEMCAAHCRDQLFLFFESFPFSTLEFLGGWVSFSFFFLLAYFWVDIDARDWFDVWGDLSRCRCMMCLLGPTKIQMAWIL